MPEISMKNMLEAGVHFGHQTHRWNPKMRPFIHGPRNGIYIIDLEKTVRYTKDACTFVKNIVADGGKVLFVATKKQATQLCKDAASRCDMPHVTERWLGGTLTNFMTIRRGVERLEQLETWKSDGTYEALPKKETVVLERKRKKLESSLGGVRSMKNLPAALFIIDPEMERIAVAEAKRLGIPVVAVVDTNCNPDPIDFVIPGNDDAIKSVTLFVNLISDACLEGAEQFETKMRVQGGGSVEPRTATSATSSVDGSAPKAAAPAGPAVERVTRKKLKIPTDIDYREPIDGEEEAVETAAAPAEEAVEAVETPVVPAASAPKAKPVADKKKKSDA